MRMDDIAALLPAQEVSTSPEVFQQLGAITRQLHDTLEQLGVMPKLQSAADGIPDARSRLAFIASKTAAAADKVLNSVDQAKAEQAEIAAATRRLAALGVHVPAVYAFDEQRLFVWLQDLGRDDLHAHRDDPWEQRRPLYEATLREAAKIHGVSADTLTAADMEAMEPAFTEGMYEWEQNYFLEHFVRGHLGRDTNEDDPAQAAPSAVIGSTSPARRASAAPSRRPAPSGRWKFLQFPVAGFPALAAK